MSDEYVHSHCMPLSSTNRKEKLKVGVRRRLAQEGKMEITIRQGLKIEVKV